MKRFLLTLVVTVGVIGLSDVGPALARWTGAPPKGSGSDIGLGASTVVSSGAARAVPSKAGGTPPVNAAGDAAATADVCGQINRGGMLPMAMSGADSKVEVKKLENGVTLTITSADPAMAKRLQQMAEAMRLMNEAVRP
jgi:hypothetical protein